MHRIVNLFIAVLLLSSPVAWAQATRPAVDSPEVAAVKSATSDFFTALTADDVSVAKAQFGGSDEDFKSIAQLHQLVVSVKAYRAAAAKKFPGYEKGRTMNNDLDPKVMAGKVQREHVTLTGDTAKMQDGTALKRIDGKWKVIDMMGDTQTKEAMSTILPGMIKAADDTTPEILRGKYSTFDEADQVMQDRMRAAAMAMMTQRMGAATKPAAPKR